jgi:hypothetical protein
MSLGRACFDEQLRQVPAGAWSEMGPARGRIIYGHSRGLDAFLIDIRKVLGELDCGELAAVAKFASRSRASSALYVVCSRDRILARVVECSRNELLKSIV